MESSNGNQVGGGWAGRIVRGLLGLPLAALGGLTTLILVFFLAADVVGRFGGGRPMQGLTGLLFFWLFFGATPLAFGLLLLNAAPRWLKSGKFLLGVAVLVVVILLDAELGPNNWHAPFRRARITSGNASKYIRTYMTPHLDVPILPGTNVIWCGTFQLAWNLACQQAGGDLKLTGGGDTAPGTINAMAAVLNRHEFTSNSIDEASCVAMAGIVKDHIDDKINSALKQKFRDAFKPMLLPEQFTTGQPKDLVAYACLYKKLSFPTAFEALEDSFEFGGKRVRAFGIGRTKAAHEQMYPQVLILDYHGSTNFVIELKTTSTGDRLILARIEPDGTLSNVVRSVQERIANCAGEQSQTNDILIVPRIALDLLREYKELEGGRPPAGLLIPPLARLLSALQTIKFDMNEKGVELRSEAEVTIACAKQLEPEREHLLIFDRPFLLLLERRGAPMPYLAMWVDNPQLMVEW